MKKLLVFLGVAMMCVSCKEFSRNSWNWEVRNRTEQTLILYFPCSTSLYESNGEYREIEIEPNAEVSFFSGSKPEEQYLHFGYCFEKSVEKFGEGVYWQVLSEDGEILKTWDYADMDLPDQRFFDESSWGFYEFYQEEWFAYMRYSWTFEILPEDIAQD